MNIQGKTAAEIFNSVRSLTQTQTLRSGDSLPPVRDLAVELGVNRNTVAAAYRKLVTAGIAVTQGRLGTQIREAGHPGEQEGALPGTPLVDLASGNPNPDWIPDLGAALSIKPYRPRLYGEPTVNEGLGGFLRQWLEPDCPSPCEIDLSHGAVDAVERLLGAYLMAGDRVAVENPCFLASINTLRTLKLQAVGVPVDAEGMRADALEQALKKGAQAVIITPRAHNPTGCSLSEKRARALRRVLARHPDVLLIIDDHFALVSSAPYHSVIPRTASRWALVRSFSKALGPDIRVAGVASDPATSRQLRIRLVPGTHWVSHLLQDIVEVMVTQSPFIDQIAQARQHYRQRRDRLEAALAEQKIRFITPGDGLNLWVPLERDEQALAFALAQRGWLVRHSEAFSLHGTVGGIRITLSHMDAAQCQRLAADLRRCLG